MNEPFALPPLPLRPTRSGIREAFIAQGASAEVLALLDAVDAAEDRAEELHQVVVATDVEVRRALFAAEEALAAYGLAEAAVTRAIAKLNALDHERGGAE